MEMLNKVRREMNKPFNEIRREMNFEILKVANDGRSMKGSIKIKKQADIKDILESLGVDYASY